MPSAATEGARRRPAHDFVGLLERMRAEEQRLYRPPAVRPSLGLPEAAEVWRRRAPGERGSRRLELLAV